MKELILGGARSGKSRWAEQCAAADGRTVCYVATAGAGDAEMAARIARHRAERPATWRTVEAPLALAETLAREAAADRCLLVDCLTLWLSNLLGHDPALAVDDPEACLARESQRLLSLLPTLPGRVILVSNEVGQGLVPADAASRRFRDEAGRLHQALATCCDRVTLVVAGLPLYLKGDPLD
ncbi:bifunctional adenosylcobinamide kinase/adenosylcobinamide-phosphate guanylyltransferase [Thiohalobacter sp. IOR34]|uniref:bifunctional adenosylcobinamide kinase/adenosylcobinamide-phosphate guanylyltransferase n=1 Tax=Thiohalobacter sp. IOR34 TaxID=3057176 RepID=UPI0025B03377|nr:bifunctional adenosylcobinamide kinase/adenosylcobinamide-phosphate guanylyltransferase [Thiohalobacter sp. IOR34]WJW75162.1 bifunctional adenosylcobinamide kinase/adenosylcobinamide-phosphate guanylyltransferase [Thiohalobacter sp. IOR34]